MVSLRWRKEKKERSSWGADSSLRCDVHRAPPRLVKHPD
jgi:hypothetical protein